MLWELVHVFFEHRGLLEGREAGPVHDTGASSFLYPFLAEGETDLEAVIEDVRASVADEGRGGRRRCASRRSPRAARRCSRPRPRCARCFDAGGKAARARQRRLGDRRDGRRRRLPRPARRAGRARRALDLTEDPAILTAIANDIGVEAIFPRQVIAYGRDGRRAARALDQRQLRQRDRGAGRGAAARARDDRAGRLRRRAGRGRGPRRPRRRHAAPSTSRGSRRRRRAPTTCCASWSSWRSERRAPGSGARGRGSRAPSRASASARTSTGSRPSSASAASC